MGLNCKKISQSNCRRGYADHKEVQKRPNSTSGVACLEIASNSQDSSSERNEESFRKVSSAMSNDDGIDTDVRKAVASQGIPKMRSARS